MKRRSVMEQTSGGFCRGYRVIIVDRDLGVVVGHLKERIQTFFLLYSECVNGRTMENGHRR